MKFTTLVKAYKLALSNIGNRVDNWDKVYLGMIDFPNKDEDILTFVFSTGYSMQPGDMGLSAAVSVKAVERTVGGLNSIAKITSDALDKDVMAREYINQKEKINEAGRMLVLFETVLDKLKMADPDKWESAIVQEVKFNFDKDLAEFDLDLMKLYTNGSLVLFGD